MVVRLSDLTVSWSLSLAGALWQRRPIKFFDGHMQDTAMNSSYTPAGIVIIKLSPRKENISHTIWRVVGRRWRRVKTSGCWGGWDGGLPIGTLQGSPSSLKRSLLPGRKPDNLDTFFIILLCKRGIFKTFFHDSFICSLWFTGALLQSKAEGSSALLCIGTWA